MASYPIPADITVHLDNPGSTPLVCIPPERYARLELAERLLAAANNITHETIWTVVRAGASVPAIELADINAASSALRDLVEAREALEAPLPPSL